MKTTHTIQDVEGLILERLEKLRDSKDKKEQRKLRSEILKLEKHFNDCNEKHLNGKKYPERQKPVPISKKDLLALIESGFPEDKWKGRTVSLTDVDYYSYNGLDLSGVFTKGARNT